MSTKENQNNDYVNDDVTDNAVIECEYVYEQGWIDDGTYVYEEESKKPSTIDVLILKQKPGHQYRLFCNLTQIEFIKNVLSYSTQFF